MLPAQLMLHTIWAFCRQTYPNSCMPIVRIYIISFYKVSN